MTKKYDQEWKTCKKVLDERGDCLDLALDGCGIFSVIEQSDDLWTRRKTFEHSRDGS
jgi:hypothetical protein